jgi:hypothetical protein
MRTYTYHDLIDAYIRTQQDAIHHDFTDYYGTLLATLERGFGLILSEPRIWSEEAEPNAQALWMVFASAVSSYNHLRTPWETILEHGAMLHRIRQWGDRGDVVFREVSEIAGLVRQNQHAHRRLIEQLFLMMYGPIDQVLTSADLLKQGFDDSLEPQLQDYL